MYPVPTTSSAASNDVLEGEDSGRSNEEEEATANIGIVEGGLQQVEAPVTDSAATALTAATTVGKGGGSKSKGKSSAKKRDVAAVSSSATTTSTTTTVTGKGVSTKDRGKASAKKRGTATVSSSEATLDPDVLGSLGVTLSPDSIQIVSSLFNEIAGLSRCIYNKMLDRQLPLIVSDGLSVIGRGIWYNTYSSMFRYFFVSRCLGEYHADHRPGFIRTLPDIQIISDSSDHSTVSLTGDVLLGFLSRLDCAILSGIESVFDSCFVEASVSLEEESLSTISCQDFVDVMSVAAIPEIALSVTLVSFAVTKSKKLRIPVDNVLVPAPTNAGKRTVRATIWTPPVVAGPSSGPIAAGGRMGSDNATVSTRARRTRADFSVQESPVSPISVEDDLPSSTVPIPFYVQCTDSLGFKLHPSSARLINDFFRDVNFAFVMSFLKSIRNYILTAMGSGLSIIERSVWLTTYRELYLHNFISRCLGIYHYNHRPAFIRNLANVRVLSDSSGLDLPLVGGDLVSFLSRLDKAVQDLISSIFDSRWCIEVDNACSGLEDISLYDVSCGDLICVLDTAGIPESALSVYQRRRERVARRNASRGSAVHIGETPGSSGGVTSEGKASRTDIASTGAASVSVQLSPKLSSRSEHGSLSRSRLQSEKQSGPLLLLEEAPDRSYRVFVRSLFCRYQSASLSATGTVSTSEVSGDVLVSTVDEGAASDEGAAYDLREDELPAPLSESVAAADACLSLPLPSAGELFAVGVASELRESGDDSPLPISSPSVESPLPSSYLPSSPSEAGLDADVSSSSTPALSLSSSPSEAGLDADVSSSSSGSPVSIREVELNTEVVVSGSGVLVSESTPAPSSEQIIVPIASPSSVSTAPIGESSTAATSSSHSYFCGPKKSMIMQFKGLLGVSTSSGVSAGLSSAAPMSSNAVSGPSASGPTDVDSVHQLVAVATDTDTGDVGVRLAALLNRGLTPSPPPAGESSGSMRGGRGRAGRGRSSSSHRGSSQGGSGRKRKRMS